MEPNLKKILKALSLELRHLLEGWYDSSGVWHGGDLEQRLAGLGVWREREPLPADEFAHLPAADRAARQVVDAYLTLRREAGVTRADAVAEFVRETAYTWANRLLALRCMEARGLIDEVIRQGDAYGGRSLEHHRLIRRRPELATGEDDGLFAALDAAFTRQAERKLSLFDPHAPAMALKPSVAALRRCVALLSGLEPLRGGGSASDEIFQAHDALGWAYQYWNTEEKDRVFEKVRTQKGAKIAGADIIPATQLYTEPYMVRFLVQNSLGALWMGMHPNSRLSEKWEYYVRDADRAAVAPKPVREISFLDPATGSGHFHLEAFDLYYDMYLEEGEITGPAEICAAILEHNLYGIDIDERAIQIAEAALWMKAAERAFDFPGAGMNLVATNIRLPKGKDHLQAFLAKHPEDRELRPALEAIFEGLEHADELGSLLQIEEPVERELRYLQAKAEESVDEPEQPPLLPEMEQPKQGKLPLGLESYKDWKERVLTQLRGHFAVEAVAADLQQAFFGRLGSKGLALFDLLARPYDVVATNPPYMGGNMGSVLRSHLAKHYEQGKHDLYTAFMLRCREFARRNGRAALVTQQSWMFLRSFADLRALTQEQAASSKPDAFKGFLRDTTLETIVHLGPGAFSEISGEVVNTVMFVFAAASPNREHALLAIRLLDADGPIEKNRRLLADLSQQNSVVTFTMMQGDLLDIVESPIIYWLPAQVLTLLKSETKLSSMAYAGEGFCTRDEARFVRYFWETGPLANNHRWVPYSKGGGYCRWSGLMDRRVDYRHKGSVVIQRITEKYPYLKGNVGLLVKDTKYYFRPGLTYSDFGRGSLGVRLLPANSIFSDTAPGLFPNEEADLFALAGILNSRINSFIIRTICTGMRLPYRYVIELPFPKRFYAFREQITCLVSLAIKLKEWEESVTPSSPTFSSVEAGLPNGGSRYLATRSLPILGGHAFRHTVEGILDGIVTWNVYELNESAVAPIRRDTGTPVGWFALVQGYDTFPELPGGLSELPSEVQTPLRRHDRRSPARLELTDIQCRLRFMYEAGPGARDSEVEDEKDDDSPVGARLPVPAETFLEELSQKLEIHPISVYWLLREGIVHGGWRCLPEERRITADHLTVIILHLLGHRWPKQIEAGEPVPDWADPDGIIPLTEGVGEPTLHDRVRECIAAEFSGGDVTAIEAEFAEIMGKPLAQWLAADFFKHQTSQFKKRPIAWQIGSGKFTARRRPAFACLVYYHKLDGNTLATIQSQYVRPLRGRYETELRGIEAIPAAARSERQATRRIELEGWIAELREFDDKLGRVATEGFDSDALTKLIAQEPVDSWCSVDGVKPRPADHEALQRQEMAYIPDLNDGVRVNIAPLQKAGLLAADVIAGKDIEKAIADRAEWRADERRWCREGKLARLGWWRGDSGTR